MIRKTVCDVVLAVTLALLSLANAWAEDFFRQDAAAEGLVSIELDNHRAMFPYTQLVVFGDSLSDTGNLYALTAGTSPADPPYYRGRYSNGEVWVELAASDMGIPLSNYAHGSALTGYDNLEGGAYPGMRTQVDAYLSANAGGVDPNALYVVWAGANDFFNLTDFSSATISALTIEATGNIATAVSQLAQFGARNFVVGGLPDLGLIPYATAPGSLANPAALTSASQAFNSQLVTSLAGVGVQYTLFDSFEILNRVVSAAANFSLDNSVDRCFVSIGDICNAPDRFLFWDDRHPTTRGHRILADQFLGIANSGAGSGHAWTFVSPPGASSGGAMEASPNTNTVFESSALRGSPRLDFSVDFVHSGIHYVWIRGISASNGDDSAHVGLDGVVADTSDSIAGFGRVWTWANNTMDGSVARISVPTSGMHTVSLWMREDGLIADKLVLTKSPTFVPSGIEPIESAYVNASNSAGGELSGGSVSNLASVDLTNIGTLDWVHYARKLTGEINRKSGVVSQMDPLVVSGTAARFISGNRTQFKWSDGSPQTSEGGEGAGLYVGGSGNGFEIEVAAGTEQRTVRFYVGGYKTRGRFEATLSDGSAAPYVATFENLNGPFDREVRLDFKAGSSGQKLKMRYTQDISAGNVTFSGVAVAGAIDPFPLPFAEGFNTQSPAWKFVNESNRQAVWRVINGALSQSERIESTATFVDSYHKGTFAYLDSAFGLTDYRVSVSAELAGAVYPEDLGLMARYRDPDNYYRLSMNTRYGFTRLEKVINGVFHTLAVNSKGYVPTGKVNLAMQVIGKTIVAEVDGQTVFAVQDSSIGSGTVALYTQENSRFDNVEIIAATDQALVRIGAPASDFVSATNTLTVSALTENAPTSARVRLVLDGVAPVDLSSEPYIHTFKDLSPGVYGLTARLLDSNGTLIDVDTRSGIGVGGAYMIGVGDSNTNGIEDNYARDNLTVFPRVRASQGYEANLAALLKNMPPYEIAIYNEGIGGDTAERALNARVGSILERHPESSTALVMLGTNDSGGSIPVRSGLECSGNDNACLSGTFRERMQDLANVLTANGLEVWVATSPPTFGSTNPWTANRNKIIREYNEVIQEQLVGIRQGPDVFDFVLRDSNGDQVAERTLVSLFGDSLHFNGLGHSALGQLWYNSIVGAATGTSTSPFVLDLLRSSTSAPLQQNLLEPGDQLWVDSDEKVVSFGSTLDDAVWVMTPQSDMNETDPAYLRFSAVRSSDVYVAYDGDVSNNSLPTWLRPSTGIYEEVPGLTVATTNSKSSSMRVFAKKASVPPNTEVQLGGNEGNTSGADSMYIVIVKPR